MLRYCWSWLSVLADTISFTWIQPSFTDSHSISSLYTSETHQVLSRRLNKQKKWAKPVTECNNIEKAHNYRNGSTHACYQVTFFSVQEYPGSNKGVCMYEFFALTWESSPTQAPRKGKRVHTEQCHVYYVLTLQHYLIVNKPGESALVTSSIIAEDENMCIKLIGKPGHQLRLAIFNLHIGFIKETLVIIM